MAMSFDARVSRSFRMLGIAGFGILLSSIAFAQPSPRTGSVAIFDPVAHRMIVFGGADRESPDPNNPTAFYDVWALSLVGPPIWQNITTTGIPPLFSVYGAAVYDSVRYRMLYYGGCDAAHSVDDQLFELRLSDMHWSSLTRNGPGLPGRPPRFHHTAVFDPVNDRMVVFGGSSNGSDFLAAAWEIRFTPNIDYCGGLVPCLSPITVPGSPAARRDHIAIYDPHWDRMIMLSGLTGDPTNYLNYPNTVNTLSLSTPEPVWALPHAEGARRLGASFVWDNKFYLGRGLYYGGRDPGCTLADFTRVYVEGNTPDPNTIAWDWISTTGVNAFARYNHNAIYDPTCDRMIVFGGMRWTGNPGCTYVPTNETLQLSPMQSYLPRWEVVQNCVPLVPGGGIGGGSGNGYMDPARGRLDQNLPNPVGPRTTIWFETPVRGPVRLEVFDLSGRRVRVLALGDYAAGSHAIEWNASDALGRRVAPGVYVYQLIASSFKAIRKMIVLP
jgi:hypothetical protein